MNTQELIYETPDVNDGYPCVGETRIGVGLIVETHWQTGGDFERTANAFPQLTPEQVRAALDYFEEHPDRVREDIQSNKEALREVQGQPWPA